MADQSTLRRALYATLVSRLSIPIYARRSPPGQAGQFAVLQFITTSREYDMEDNSGGVTDTTVQVDCYADTQDKTTEAARVVRAAMRTVSGVLGAAPERVRVWGVDAVDERDYRGQEGDHEDNRIGLDFLVQWTEDEVT